MKILKSVNYHNDIDRYGAAMENMIPSVIFFSMMIVFSVDATRKRREYLNKNKRR